MEKFGTPYCICISLLVTPLHLQKKIVIKNDFPKFKIRRKKFQGAGHISKQTMQTINLHILKITEGGRRILTKKNHLL